MFKKKLNMTLLHQVCTSDNRLYMKIVNNANFVFPFKITLLRIKICANIFWINKSWRRLKITPNYIKLKMRNNSNKDKKGTEKIREYLDYIAKQKIAQVPTQLQWTSVLHCELHRCLYNLEGCFREVTPSGGNYSR